MNTTLSSSHDLITRTRWYIYLRWFILLVIILPTIVSLYIIYGWSEQLRYDAILGFSALLMNAVFYIACRFVKTPRAIRTLATSIFVIDILLITYFIHTNGGLDSRSITIYVLPIIMASAIFGRKGTYVFGLLSMLAYSTLIIINYFGFFLSPDPMIAVRQTNIASVVNTLVFFNSLLLLISLTVDFIAQILISKEKTALRHLEDLRRAQAIAQFGSWEWNRASNQVSWSAELYRIFGVERSDQPMTFEQYMAHIHPDDRQRMTDAINDAAVENISFSVDHRIILPDGNIRYIHSDGQPLTDAHGTLIRMIGTARDITDTTLLEKAKNDFVSLTSHQLRTPATIVKQYAVMLNDGYVGELNPQQKKFLQTIYDSNERQISIINDLLNIARIDSGTFRLDIQRTDIVALLSQIVTEHKSKFKTKRHKLIFIPPYKSVYCQIDREQFRMVIENLLDNAHKYTPQKKSITIGLKRRRPHVEISVSDQGIGIPAADIDKVFTIFSRIDNSMAFEQEGTGIGLYWVKKIVSLHGGNITVTSELRKGSMFTIALPYKHR